MFSDDTTAYWIIAQYAGALVAGALAGAFQPRCSARQAIRKGIWGALPVQPRIHYPLDGEALGVVEAESLVHVTSIARPSSKTSRLGSPPFSEGIA